MQSLATNANLKPYQDALDAAKWLDLMGAKIAVNILGISRATLFRRAQLGRGIMQSNLPEVVELRKQLGIDSREKSKEEKIKVALELRRDESLSTRAIADQLKVSQSTVSRWLRGYHLL
jgi:hypothetical protein